MTDSSMNLIYRVQSIPKQDAMLRKASPIAPIRSLNTFFTFKIDGDMSPKLT